MALASGHSLFALAQNGRLMVNELQSFSDRLGYAFSDIGLLQDALMHPSLELERRNERLEFLGDRVLGLVLAQWLLQAFPAEAEGPLARRLAYLGSGDLCAKIMDRLDLLSALNSLSSKSLALTPRIAGNCCEALIAAIYLDGGMDAANRFIKMHWQEFLAEAEPIDAKTLLQEYLAKRKAASPVYQIIDRAGPTHAPTFDVEVSVDGIGRASAQGPSRRQAEQEAAKKWLSDFAEVRV